MKTTVKKAKGGTRHKTVKEEKRDITRSLRQRHGRVVRAERLFLDRQRARIERLNVDGQVLTNRAVLQKHGCEGFRMTALRDGCGWPLGPSSESLQRTNPREVKRGC